MVQINEIVTMGSQKALEYAPKVGLALIVLIIGLFVIGWISKLTDKAMHKNKVDASLRHFLSSLVGALLKILLVIAVIGMLGVETSSFVAILAAMGFAIGLALQGSLGNFAGGVLIIVFKPFKVGDFITAQGESGVVKKIEIFTTTLNTPDNKTIIIPNGPLSNGNITNFSTEKTRRVDMTFGIGYDDDSKKAREIILRLLNADRRVLKDPKPFVRLSELADSSVNFTVRAWTQSEDYWEVYFDMQEKVKEEFDKAKIGIPFPQMDVHIHK